MGLKRHKFSLTVRKALAHAFRLVFRSDLTVEEALDRIESELSEHVEVMHFVNFCRQSKRGIIGLSKQPENKDERLDLEEEEAEEVLSLKQ